MNSYEANTDNKIFNSDSVLRGFGIVPRSTEDASVFLEMTKNLDMLVTEEWVLPRQVLELGTQPTGQTYSLENIKKIVSWLLAAKVELEKVDDIDLQNAKSLLTNADSILDGLRALKSSYPENLDVLFVLDDLG